MKPGQAIHPVNGVSSGTAPSDAVAGQNPLEIPFDAGPNSASRYAVTAVIVSNMDATVPLAISFAGGRDGLFFRIPPLTTINLPVSAHRAYLYGVGATCLYSIMGIGG